MAERGSSERLTFLPQGATALLPMRRRAGEVTGLVLLVLALGLAAMLASYEPSDPSWNSASGAEPANWLGGLGARGADFLLQTLGLAAVLPVLVLTAWAWRLASHRGLDYFWLRLILLPLCLLATAVGLATVSAPAAWPLVVGRGGVFGDLLLAGIGNANQALGLVPWPNAVAIAMAGLAGLALILSLGIGLAEWRAIARASLWCAKSSGEAAGAGLGWLHAFSRRAASRAVRREPRLVRAPDRDEDGTDLAGPRLGVPESSVPRRVAKPRSQTRRSKRAEAEDQSSLDLGPTGIYQLPPLGLLQPPVAARPNQTVNEEALEQNARVLESVLDDYGVRGRIIKVRPGPVVALYELEPAPGTKTSRVIGLADDIARSMSALSVRVAVVPGRNVIGIELPNQSREMVYLRELFGTREFEGSENSLSLALGKDISGAPIIADLAKMPHLLIAGTTGSGKVGGDQRHDPLAALPPVARALPVHHDRPEDAGAQRSTRAFPISWRRSSPSPSKAVVALKWTVREMEEPLQARCRASACATSPATTSGSRRPGPRARR